MKASISQIHYKTVGKELQKVLADTFILSLKTRHYHWNIMGPHFKSFHELFNEIYEKLDDMGDRIAERIRALGQFPQGNYKSFVKDTLIKEETNYLKEMEIVEQLVYDMEILVKRSYEMKEIALKNSDDVTGDLMIQHLGHLEKLLWMLKSHLVPMA